MSFRSKQIALQKRLDRGLISFGLATLYTGTGGLCQGDARVLPTVHLPGDLECRGEPRATLSNKITGIAMLRIGNGKAHFSHGPEVEYGVKREYSPDESGYVENYRLIFVLRRKSHPL